MKTTVIHHSADYDGIFCREIARKFLPDAELIGWDFGDPPLSPGRLAAGKIYVMDLPVAAVFAMAPEALTGAIINDLVWIDHHKSSIDSHPTDIPGYRIDGVAACRLAWQWFNLVGQVPNPEDFGLPSKEQFVKREVSEPLAVRLAGEYDIWDHRDSDADIAFQYGLDAQESIDWRRLLAPFDLRPDGTVDVSKGYCDGIVNAGRYAMRCYAKRDADIMRGRSFKIHFEGLNFLALNTARCNSISFAALDVPETGHDALMGFYWNGEKWTVSLYHAKHRTDLDLSEIAVEWGGGGHRGACGFSTKLPLPFIP